MHANLKKKLTKQNNKKLGFSPRNIQIQEKRFKKLPAEEIQKGASHQPKKCVLRVAH